MYGTTGSNRAIYQPLRRSTKMSTDLKVIMADDQIPSEHGGDIEQFIELYRTWKRKFEFLHCAWCDGLVLGHRPKNVELGMKRHMIKR